MRDTTTVAVVGGGVAGLVAARRLARAGAEVTLIEGGARLGGQVRTVTVADRRVDVGAEALYTGAADAMALVEELGLTGELVVASRGRTWIWGPRGLRRLPAGVGPGGPTRLRPVLGSRLLSPRGLARAAVEPLVTRSVRVEDEGVGTFLTRRFGHEVTERPVDPVLGSLHAGDVSRLSLQAVTPQLAATAADRRSLLAAGRGKAGGPPPSFATFRHGLGTLVERLAADSDATVRCSTPVEAITSTRDGYRLEGPSGLIARSHAIVVALPARAAARLLRGLVPAAADGLEDLRSASVATVVAAYPREAVEAIPLFLDNGLLVPSSARRLLKAAIFLSAKWPHLAHPDRFLVRLSAGRAGSAAVSELDDSQLVDRLLTDLAEATGLTAKPVQVRVQRWPGAMAQLEVGHLDLLASVRDELGRLPRLVLAGAAYDGLGIAACVRSGEQAAATLRPCLPGAVEALR